MKISLFGLAGTAALFAAVNASAIPYPNIGAYNSTTYTFTATADGPVTAYFYGQTAGYDSVIGMAINGTPVGAYFLPNHSTTRGQSAVLGNVQANDIISFILQVSNDPNGVVAPFLPINYTWSSDPSKNADGINHIYSAPFAGDNSDPLLPIPAGTYVGFEDLPKDGDQNWGQDFDYDDHQFVFTGPFQATQSVPEAGSTAMFLGLASLGLAAIRSRRK
jgi:hypothetical protein